MIDQATQLRGLMERHAATIGMSESLEERSTSATSRAHTITVTSGKGGVGKSVLSLNLAIAMSQLGKSVCLLDANSGLGNLDLLCGLNGYWNLEHVVSGARRIEQILLEGPAGIHLVSGANGLQKMENCSTDVLNDIFAQLDKLEQEHDVIIVDTGSGIHNSVRQFALSSDDILVVSTAELTAIADAYTTIKTLATARADSLKVVINRSSPEMAGKIQERLQQTSKIFLHTQTSFAGSIPDDPAVVQSVATRTPFLITNPDAPASLAVRDLAKQLCYQWNGRSQEDNYFTRLGEHLLSRAA